MRMCEKSCTFAATKLRTMKKAFIIIVSLLLVFPNLRAENAGVPAECEDVMLQAFYWDSYKLTKYGRTTWNDLTKDTAAITANFDLVWFPPSASSSGGVGYYHACLSNQDSDWGKKAQLTYLIKYLHDGGTKVIGDVVINHRGNKSSWCDFWPDEFSIKGNTTKFQLTEEHICSGDECFTTSGSSCYGSTTRGAADTGTNDAGARDLDHSNEYVQAWAKKYLEWMMVHMRYDGFRYDMTRGYHGRYLKMYNESAQPYISVSEYWEGIDNTVNHLKATEYNTMIFDFPLKYALGEALKVNNLRALVKPTNSLRGKGFGKYAVTFIDNHDTFERSDAQTQEFIGYNVDLQDAANKNKILQANAYILMLPGVPCVFWPHWKSYPTEINALIALRKLAGIHSESEILSETCESNVYEVKVQGHRGVLILRMGPTRSKEAPDGFYTALEGGETANYTIFALNGTGLETVTPQTAKGEKFIENGTLYIRVGETVYDALGNRIKN